MSITFVINGVTNLAFLFEILHYPAEPVVLELAEVLLTLPCVSFYFDLQVYSSELYTQNFPDKVS